MGEKEKAIKIIRDLLFSFGIPLDDLSDDEIEAGINRASKAIANFGLTMEEAADALKKAPW